MSYLKCQDVLVIYFSEETVMDILPLADEYQVQHVIEKCTSCLVDMIQKSDKHPIGVDKYLQCLNYAEHYNLTSVLSIAPNGGREYTILSLKNAGIDEKISTGLKMEILEEKCKLMDSFFEGKYFCL